MKNHPTKETKLIGRRRYAVSCYVLERGGDTIPAYKDKKRGTWYTNFYYQDWTGERKHKCKRGFKTQREAKEWERTFLDQQSKSSDILFSSLIENYKEDMGHRLKPTTMENKQYLIEGKLLPYFGKLKICDIDTIVVRKWQNVILKGTDEKGKPYSPPPT